MKKQTLNSFIDKYSLNGTIESVKWVVDDKEIKTSSISDDKNVLSLLLLKIMPVWRILNWVLMIQPS